MYEKVIGMLKEDNRMDTKTAIYPRVSTTDQKKEGISFGAQEAKFRKICEETGRKLQEVYKGEGDAKDDTSASYKDSSINVRVIDDELVARFSLKKRPNFKRMLVDAANGKFDELMFFKWDRFSRNVAFQELAIIYLLKHGIKLYPTDDSKDPMTRRVMSVLNQEMPEKIASSLKLTLERKFEQGVMINPRMPLGYRWHKKKHIALVDEAKAKIVNDIFEDVANGINYKEVCKKHLISHSKLYFIIRNRVYIGYIEYLGRENKGIHQPIISQELFEKANSKLGN